MSQNSTTELDLLWHIAGQQEPVAAKELIKYFDVGRATIYRMLDELTCTGWLEVIGSPRRFRPSLKVVQLGFMAVEHYRVRETILPYAIELARATRQFCSVVLYDKGEVVATDGVEVLGDRVLTYLRNERAPAASTAVGKILLAHQDPLERRRVSSQGLPRLTPFTRTTPEQIDDDLTACLRRGFGSTEGEFRADRAGIGVPVFDANGRAVAGIGVRSSMPLLQEFVEQVLEPAKIAATLAAKELGFRRGPESSLA